PRVESTLVDSGAAPIDLVVPKPDHRLRAAAGYRPGALDLAAVFAASRLLAAGPASGRVGFRAHAFVNRGTRKMQWIWSWAFAKPSLRPGSGMVRAGRSSSRDDVGHGARGHRAVAPMAVRRYSGARQADAAHRRGTAPTRAPLHGSRAARSRVANDGARQRG